MSRCNFSLRSGFDGFWNALVSSRQILDVLGTRCFLNFCIISRFLILLESVIIQKPSIHQYFIYLINFMYFYRVSIYRDIKTSIYRSCVNNFSKLLFNSAIVYYIRVYYDSESINLLIFYSFVTSYKLHDFFLSPKFNY